MRKIQKKPAIMLSWIRHPMAIYDNISGDSLATALKNTLRGANRNFQRKSRQAEKRNGRRIP
jgi:hypothetical protein